MKEKTAEFVGRVEKQAAGLALFLGEAMGFVNTLLSGYGEWCMRSALVASALMANITTMGSSRNASPFEVKAGAIAPESICPNVALRVFLKGPLHLLIKS